MYQLTPHFSLEELTFSHTAVLMKIDNTPDEEVLSNLNRLAQVLEKVRTLVKHPIYINSGYRCPELNAAVHGVSDSAHLHGLAADIECPDLGTPYDVCHFLQDHVKELGIDQLILEYDSWTHIGLRDGEPRHMALTIDSQGTQTGIV